MEFVKSVLLIDDNPSCNFIMTEFIKLADHSIVVLCAESVPEALEILSKSADVFPEVIYVDINMPVQNGFDFVEQYESAYQMDHPSSKLFMLSSSLREEDKAKALKYKSVCNFVSKNEIDDFLQVTLMRKTA
jgi:CheY-like chemotaxis protein